MSSIPTINSEQDYSVLFGTLKDSGEKPSPLVNKSRHQDIHTSRLLENKRTRVISDEEGNTRRPTNITIRDDVKIALDVLAARRRVKVWTLIDRALREFLEREKAL